MGIDSEYQGGTYEQVLLRRERRQASERRAGKVFRVCRHCGNQGPDVYFHAVHVGEEGYPQGNFCLDRQACRKRMEEGLTW